MLVEADVVAVCERNGIPAVDVRPRLEAAFTGTEKSLYHEVGWHLNVTGNQVAGKGIFSWMDGAE